MVWWWLWDGVVLWLCGCCDGDGVVIDVVEVWQW